MKRIFMAMLMLLAAAGCEFAVTGCESVDNFDMFRFPGADMGVSHDMDPAQLDLRVVDLTPPPDLLPPPDLTPPIPHYREDIQNDIVKLGCATAACHSFYAPLIMPTPSSDAQWQQNYTNIKGDAINGEMSLILTKNLAGNNVAHAGASNVKPFATTNDPTYKKWLYWIQNGSPY